MSVLELPWNLYVNAWIVKIVIVQHVKILREERKLLVSRLQLRVLYFLVEFLELSYKLCHILALQLVSLEVLINLLDKASVILAYMVLDIWLGYLANVSKHLVKKSIHFVSSLLASLLHAVLDKLYPVTSPVLWINEAI